MAVAAALLVVAGAGCGDRSRSSGPTTPTTAKAVDTREVESLLVSTQKRATPEFEVRDPSCPARVVVAEGATFRCTVVVEGVVAGFDVSLRAVDSGNRTGQFEIRPAQAIVPLTRLVDVLRAGVPGANPDCGPDRVRLFDVGATFSCVVSTPQASQTLTFRVDDLTGNVTQT